MLLCATEKQGIKVDRMKRTLIFSQDGMILMLSSENEALSGARDKSESFHVATIEEYIIRGDGTLWGAMKIFNEIQWPKLYVDVVAFPKIVDNDARIIDRWYCSVTTLLTPTLVRTGTTLQQQPNHPYIAEPNTLSFGYFKNESDEDCKDQWLDNSNIYTDEQGNNSTLSSSATPYLCEEKTTKKEISDDEDEEENQREIWTKRRIKEVVSYAGPAGMTPQARPPQFGTSQPFINQYAPPPLGGVETRVERQEDKSSSVKKSESMGTSNFGANPVNGAEEDHRKDEIGMFKFRAYFQIPGMFKKWHTLPTVVIQGIEL
ncbi:ATP-dependent 6-phosphofructokinase 2 [Artemisia annua]|uniref:ATP-dependent 6-phosphofructokinase 2 n=1 Tax=Artemisia annua TaxID=35608 RepID=A0A2U1LKV0_ARTAN|nr:ATP-dependent 6-phosphofructokinase 2 [Artemisia annua]